jgi:alginate O-acetyltransferase complex protein AlgI
MGTPREGSAPLWRYVLAWTVMVGGLAGVWGGRPWLDATTFIWAQFVVLLVTWKFASLLCLPPGTWPRFTPLRFLAYCIWYGMQPQQFLRGFTPTLGTPVPTIRGLVLNIAGGALLVWGVPYLLPDATPLTVRFWIAMAGFTLFLIARFDLYGLVFRAVGIPVEKLWDCPIAATTLGEFWGRRWNRVVSGMAREIIFFPVARLTGAKVALFAVFLYSGVYHEIASFMTQSGYGGPTAYFLLQYVGVAIESIRPVRRHLQRHPWMGRAWTIAVVLLPVGLLFQPALVDEFLMPLMVRTGVPGLSEGGNESSGG